MARRTIRRALLGSCWQVANRQRCSRESASADLKEFPWITPIQIRPPPPWLPPDANCTGSLSVCSPGLEYEATGEIALRVTPGGFGTTAGPEMRLEGARPAGDRKVPAAGSFRDLADRLGVKFGEPTIGYRDGSGAQPDDVADLDPAAVGVIVDWFALSDVLRVLDPGQQPILWPEHSRRRDPAGQSLVRVIARR